MPFKDAEARREYYRNYRRLNKDRDKHLKDAQKQKHRLDRKSKMRAYLECHPCVDCGEADPLVLDFDHTDPAQKSFNISTMVRDGRAWDLIQREINKCEIRCANCHRRRTARQFGWLY